MGGPPSPIAHAGSYGATGPPLKDAEPSRWGLPLLVGLLCLAVLAEGYDIGVLNGVLVRIQDELGVGSFEVAILVTMTPLFVIPGSLLAGWAADLWGRLPTIEVTSLLLVAGPLIMALAPDLFTLVCGRAVAGLGIGFGFVVVSTYVTEVAPANRRGELVAFMEVALNVGMLLGYVANRALLGVKNDWRIMLALGSVLSAVLAVCAFCGLVPESPRWLFLRQRWQEGRTVLARFAGGVEAEETMEAWAEGPQSDTVSWREVLWPWKDGRLTRQLAAGIVVAVSQMACGNLVVAYYSSKVMKRVMGESMAFMNTMIMGAVKTAVVIGVTVFLERSSRRMLLLGSVFVVMCGSVLIAVAFMHSWSSWALASGFWLFMAGFSLGLGPVAFVYLAEVFPTAVRGKGMSLSILVSRGVGVASTLSFPLVTDGLGVPATFLLIAAVNAMLMVLIWFVVEDVHRTSEPTHGDSPFVRRVS